MRDGRSGGGIDRYGSRKSRRSSGKTGAGRKDMSFVCGSKTGGLGGSLIERAEPPARLSERGSVLSVSGGAGMTLTLTGGEEGEACLVLTNSFGGGWIARSGLGMGARRGGGKTSGDSVLVDFTPAGKRGKE